MNPIEQFIHDELKSHIDDCMDNEMLFGDDGRNISDDERARRAPILAGWRNGTLRMSKMTGILDTPGVAMLVDDGVTRGPMGPVQAIALEGVQTAYHRLVSVTTYRPASLLPASVSHE